MVRNKGFAIVSILVVAGIIIGVGAVTFLLIQQKSPTVDDTAVGQSTEAVQVSDDSDRISVDETGTEKDAIGPPRFELEDLLPPLSPENAEFQRYFDIYGLERLEGGYVRVGPLLYYSRNNVLPGKKLPGFDAESFVYLEGGVAKSKNNVYFKDTVVSEADASTFELIQGSYTKDGKTTFYPTKYYKDEANVFIHLYNELAIFAGADVATFAFVGSCSCTESTCNEYFKDKDYVYLNGYLQDSIDTETFTYLGNFWVAAGRQFSGAYAKDKNTVYYSCGTILENADSATFTAVNDGYAKDSQNVYYFGDKVEGGNPSKCTISRIGQCSP